MVSVSFFTFEKRELQVEKKSLNFFSAFFLPRKARMRKMYDNSCTLKHSLRNFCTNYETLDQKYFWQKTRVSYLMAETLIVRKSSQHSRHTFQRKVVPVSVFSSAKCKLQFRKKPLNNILNPFFDPKYTRTKMCEVIFQLNCNLRNVCTIYNSMESVFSLSF